MTKPPPPDGYRDWCEWCLDNVQDLLTVSVVRLKRDESELMSWAYADYAALRAEVERLKKELEQK